MAEAEDVLVDAARHATVHARRLWSQYRPERTARELTLADVAERLAVLMQGLFGISPPIRVAQEPAPPTMLTRVFRRQTLPRPSYAIPATNGTAIWLPRHAAGDADVALEDYRCMAVLQAERILRDSTGLYPEAVAAGLQDVYLLAEAAATHSRLVALLPGSRHELERFRARQLARRPPIDDFPAPRRPLEVLARAMMRGELPDARIATARWTRADSLVFATEWVRSFPPASAATQAASRLILFRDRWTGELRPTTSHATSREGGDFDTRSVPSPPRSARLARRPDVRARKEDEDDERPGAWMIQSSQPAETAEDPFGMQRPVDQDQDAAADEYADSVSELAEARLVGTPERAREILLSDDPPDAATRREVANEATESEFRYPEWDYRQTAYRHPGARVRLLPAAPGPAAWVTQTLDRHRAMCEDIRRRFEMLRADRQRIRKQLDGDELDLEAYVDARADMLAGLPMGQAMYQSARLTRRDMAITLLVDISGSTDSWISESRRVIDVAREALLLVCIALQGLREPYSVLAFSGEGRDNVVVREVKSFDESFGETVANRIAGLEPEHYTRAGAALRHATARLMGRGARHRLLLVLTDGKPNDNDEYDGRYGAEDMRQSVTEARLQGIYPFCLTIDRQAASYLPRVFGATNYALLHKPQSLPAVLLEWLRRLIAA